MTKIVTTQTAKTSIGNISKEPHRNERKFKACAQKSFPRKQYISNLYHHNKLVYDFMHNLISWELKYRCSYSEIGQIDKA